MVKIMSHVKEGFDISQYFKAPKHSKETEETSVSNAEHVLGDVDSIRLNATSKNISNHVAGYIYFKKPKHHDEFCGQLILSDEPNDAYIEILSKRNFKNPFNTLK